MIFIDEFVEFLVVLMGVEFDVLFDECLVLLFVCVYFVIVLDCCVGLMF